MKELMRSWKTEKGTKVSVIGRLITERTIYADGWNVKVDCCEIEIDVTVDGHGSQGGWVKEIPASIIDQAPAGCTHMVGKLPITKEQAEIIYSVKAELEADPRWKAKQMRIEQNAKANQALDETRARNGLCPKCETYCYGDCDAATY